MSSLGLVPTQPPVQGVVVAFSLGVKWLECEANNSPPCGAEVKDVWSCVCVYGMHGDSFTFYFLP